VALHRDSHSRAADLAMAAAEVAGGSDRRASVLSRMALLNPQQWQISERLLPGSIQATHLRTAGHRSLLATGLHGTTRQRCNNQARQRLR
jgi:hypothetical protein